MNSKVWFITGAARCFGRIWTEAALKRGDKVAATARRLEDVADLKLSRTPRKARRRSCHSHPDV